MEREQPTIDILKILEKDSRTPPAQIAAMTGIAETEVQSIIASLEEQGIIKRYKTVIHWGKAGREYVNAFIDVKVTPSRGVGFDDRAYALNLVQDQCTDFWGLLEHRKLDFSGFRPAQSCIQGQTSKKIRSC